MGGRRCLVWRTRPRAARRGGASCSAASGALLGRTADGVLVRCGAGQLEILRAQIPPGPAVEGPALARLLGPVPGPGFAGA